MKQLLLASSFNGKSCVPGLEHSQICKEFKEMLAVVGGEG